MIVHALREAVIAALKAALPEAAVAGHGGTFTEEELRRYAARSPALMVSVSDVGNCRFEGRHPIGDVGIGIALLAGTGKKGQPSDAVALAALAVVLRLVSGQRWDVPGVDGPPEGLRAQNLYSAQIDAGNIALWGISWRQSVEFGAGLLSAEERAALDDFLTVRLTQVDAGDGAALTDDVFNVRTGESFAPESEDGNDD